MCSSSSHTKLVNGFLIMLLLLPGAISTFYLAADVLRHFRIVFFLSCVFFFFLNLDSVWAFKVQSLLCNCFALGIAFIIYFIYNFEIIFNYNFVYYNILCFLTYVTFLVQSTDFFSYQSKYVATRFLNLLFFVVSHKRLLF